MLDTLFGFLLAYPPVVAVTAFSIVALVLINVFYKILINQHDAKMVKERVNEISKKMREEQKKGNVQQSNAMLGDVMKENSKLMKMTLKPMIVSFVIVLVLLPWLHAHYGDVVVQANSTALKLEGVEYPIAISDGSVTVAGAECSTPCTQKIGNQLFAIRNENNNIVFAPVVAVSPVPIPWKGTLMGWLFWYILVSIPLVMLIRKLMKIYV